MRILQSGWLSDLTTCFIDIFLSFSKKKKTFYVLGVVFALGFTQTPLAHIVELQWHIFEASLAFVFALGFTRAPLVHIFKLQWHIFELHQLLFLLWASPKLHWLILSSVNDIFWPSLAFVFALGFTLASLAHIVELHWLLFLLWASPNLHWFILLSFIGS